MLSLPCGREAGRGPPGDGAYISFHSTPCTELAIPDACTQVLTGTPWATLSIDVKVFQVSTPADIGQPAIPAPRLAVQGPIMRHLRHGVLRHLHVNYALQTVAKGPN